MGALIDSSVLIAAERGELELPAAIAGYEDQDVALSAITASELLHGVHRARSQASKARREAWVESLLTRLPVLSFDLVAARIHARLSARLAAVGATVGAHDLIIAATALSRELDVITRDERSFPKIPDVVVERR